MAMPVVELDGVGYRGLLLAAGSAVEPLWDTMQQLHNLTNHCWKLKQNDKLSSRPCDSHTIKQTLTLGT